MNKKICFLVSVFIALIYLGSCDSNDVTQEQVMKSMSSSVSVERSFVNETFMPLNYIPQEVSKRMGKDELKVWKKVSSQFYLNYGIINTNFYEKHKEEVLNLALQQFDKAKEMGAPHSKLIFKFEQKEGEENGSYWLSVFAKYEEDNYILKAGNYSMDDTTVCDDDDIDADTTDVSRKFLGYGVVTYTNIFDKWGECSISLSVPYIAELYKGEFCCTATGPMSMFLLPEGASFEGLASIYVGPGQYANIYLNGKYKYKSLVQTVIDYSTKDLRNE